MNLTAPTGYVRDTGTIKGRGVFASRPLAGGETIEECPVVLFSGVFGSVPDEVRKLLFNWGVLANAPGVHCLALGYGSLYNHDNPANMRFEGDAGAGVLRFIAVRDIAQGEELTVNYSSFGGSHESGGESWFTRMGLEAFSSELPQTGR